jgi:aldehyde:ferredoxin oxidoreductase
MKVSEKRELLMKQRKGELDRLVRAYYDERGWNPLGIPTVPVLEEIGLWKFLDEATRMTISELNS